MTRSSAAAMVKVVGGPLDGADEVPASYEPEYDFGGDRRRLRKLRRLLWS